MLSGKGIVRAGYGNKDGKGILRASFGNNYFLILPHPLTNFEVQKYYQNEPRYNGVYSRDNLPKKIKDRAYVINLDDYADVGTNWIALYVLNIKIIYFDSFGVEDVPKEIRKFIGHKNIKTNIFRVQANDSIKCGYACIGFIDFILADETLMIILVCFHIMVSKKMLV